MAESTSEKRITAGVLAIVLGAFGVHKFYLGYTGAGVLMLVATLLTCGTITTIVSVIEGIVYLCKNDEDFNATYVVGRKEWF